MISFQKATESDITLLRELAENSWKSAYADILSPEQIAYMLGEMYSTEVISGQIKSPGYRYYFIFEDNVAVGFLGYELHYEKDTTKLHRIYLLADAKGKGFGKAALQFLQQTVRESGDCRIILNVNKNNPAQHFYKAQGFTIYDEGIFDIGNGYVMDDYLMELKF